MLSSLRINVSFLHMLSHCLRLVFYFVLMNWLLYLNGSNLELCILDDYQLCPFPRLILHPKLFWQLLFRMTYHQRQVQSVLICLMSLVLNDLPEYHIPLISMVFSTLLLMLLCLLFPSLHVFLRLLKMNVGKKQWMRNFRLSRTIIHGTWFLVLLMLKPLVLNGFTWLSSALMGLWIGLKLGKLLLGTSKNMGWTMGRHLLRWWRWQQCVQLFPLPPPKAGHFTRWT